MSVPNSDNKIQLCVPPAGNIFLFDVPPCPSLLGQVLAVTMRSTPLAENLQ